MFDFITYQVRTYKGQVFYDQIQEENQDIISFLNHYENKVYEILKERVNFKFVLGCLPRNFGNILHSNNFNDQDFTIDFHTQHSGTTGTKLINEFLDYTSDSKRHYILTFEGYLGKIWKDSSSDMDGIIENLNTLIRKADLKKELDFKIITITGSSKIKFEQVNLGGANRKYRVL